MFATLVDWKFCDFDEWRKEGFDIETPIRNNELFPVIWDFTKVMKVGQ